PTNYTPYELVFRQHPLRHFNIIEEWKQHNINMEKDLPKGIIEDEEGSENEDNNLSDEYEDFNEITQINNMERDSASQSLIVASPSSSRSSTPFSDIFQEEDRKISSRTTLCTLSNIYLYKGPRN
ncbi:11348_t:CDS:1, partial [Dentiscutata heterogama]